ncbi:hypothetical protein BCR39DRAFT_528281 [Naematelia encephala]|uniref:Uncharacterized protein n=1 Tax=Naematelia encephala TaxID=71784 RepID=A0A1Y2B8C8_9TREE|nr:hypothetical protein BCR39DRAFT_528281 [Naematelia encephala]
MSLDPIGPCDSSPISPDTDLSKSSSLLPQPTGTSSVHHQQLPSLEYTLKTRKRSITIIWSLLIIDSVVLPISLYFALWYGTSLTPNNVFTVITAVIGIVSLIKYALRTWNLIKKSSACRPRDARRWSLDWFHWWLTFMWILIIIELVVGSIPTLPPIRVLALPGPTALFVWGTLILLMEVLRLANVRAPIRISSQPRGSIILPAIYPIIEDIVAVDGGGGTAYRDRLGKRYEASSVFRQMLGRLSLAWGIGAELAGAVTIALVFTIEKDAAYVVGWALPVIWAGVWAVLTIWYVKKELKRELNQWYSQSGEDTTGPDILELGENRIELQNRIIE